MSPSACVVFDLDGTLADTSGDLLAAANACFRALGHGDVLEPGRDGGVALHGGVAMLRRGFERLGLDDVETRAREQNPKLVENYRADICVHTQLYPGAREAVATLADEGYRLAVCTNKPHALAEQLLDALDFRAPFAAVVGADTLPVRKPDPAPLAHAIAQAGGVPERACLVGDSSTDHKTARALGVPSLLVTLPPNDEDLVPLAPDALVHRFADLPGIVAGLNLAAHVTTRVAAD